MAKIKKLDKQFPSVRIWSHLRDTTQTPSPPPTTTTTLAWSELKYLLGYESKDSFF